MDGTPHTHEVELRRQYNSAGGFYYVKYGDTKVRVPRIFWIRPSESRFRRAVAKAVRRHDAGSIKAVRDEHWLRDLNGKLTTKDENRTYGRPVCRTDAWGSDLIKGAS